MKTTKTTIARINAWAGARIAMRWMNEMESFLSRREQLQKERGCPLAPIPLSCWIEEQGSKGKLVSGMEWSEYQKQNNGWLMTDKNIERMTEAAYDVVDAALTAKEITHPLLRSIYRPGVRCISLS